MKNISCGFNLSHYGIMHNEHIISSVFFNHSVLQCDVKKNIFFFLNQIAKHIVLFT